MSRINAYINYPSSADRVVKTVVIPGLNFATEKKEDIDRLADFIRKHSAEIRSIDFKNVNLSACEREPLENLFRVIGALPCLESIDLSGNNLIKLPLNIGHCLVRCPNLISVELSDCLNDSDAHRKLEVLEGFLGIASLRSLTCVSCKLFELNKEQIIRLGVSLRKAKNLQDLNLRGNRFEVLDEESFDSLVAILSSLSLEKLNLSGNHLFSDQQVICRHSPRLATQFLLDLVQKPTLKSLSLSFVGLGGNPQLAEFFNHLTRSSVCELDISNNELILNESMVTSFVSLLQKIGFRHLNISSNHLDDAAIEALCSAASVNPELRVFNARGGSYTDDAENKINDIERILQARQKSGSSALFPPAAGAGGAGSDAGGAGSEERNDSDSVHPAWTHSGGKPGI